MKQFFYLLTVSTVLLASCTQPFKKGQKGLEYKIISDGNGNKIKNGEFFEIQFKQTYKSADLDTVLYNSADKANQIAPMDSASIPPEYLKIFSQIKKGDSIVIKQLVDSIIKEGMTPPYMKKGGSLIAYYKIVNIYTTKEAADSAYQVQMHIARTKDSLNAIAQIEKDDKIIADYLASKNIKAQKTGKGTYVEIIQEGTGGKVNDSTGVKINYTGTTFSGTKFDSNVDTQFHHTEPILVNMWAPRVIPGWVEGLGMLSKGTKARFYIPSSLAYGVQGRQPDIKPNDNLIFDVEVIDILNKEQGEAEEMAEQQKMMQQQQMMQQMQQQMQQQQQKPAGK